MVGIYCCLDFGPLTFDFILHHAMSFCYLLLSFVIISLVILCFIIFFVTAETFIFILFFKNLHGYHLGYS